MLLLYKIEVQLEDKLIHLIIAADSDEKAFASVESHVARHFIRMPEIRSAAIVEKKRIEPGNGFVIEG
ncbi:DUF3906 family protein [Paenibacillus humicola]|uniref:DUF3906 family protein n=1 Tax=Paenibacillus humicola TaxID=3110540 RepID=UPI00237AAF2D|nr:DUF3906 family protein [Paenibacillus humicola]